MEKLGKKIKRIRKEKKLTQENLDRDRPSHISQIELGLIKKPTVDTLNRIAKILDLELEELVAGTDYKMKEEKKPAFKLTPDTQYVFSMDKMNINIDGLGQLSIKPTVYPRFNKNGQENIYCPETGSRLIDMCERQSFWGGDIDKGGDAEFVGICGRVIENPNTRYCPSCSNPIYPLGYEEIEDLFPIYGVTENLSDNLRAQDTINKLIHEKKNWKSINLSIPDDKPSISEKIQSPLEDNINPDWTSNDILQDSAGNKILDRAKKIALSLFNVDDDWRKYHWRYDEIQKLKIDESIKERCGHRAYFKLQNYYDKNRWHDEMIAVDSEDKLLKNDWYNQVRLGTNSKIRTIRSFFIKQNKIIEACYIILAQLKEYENEIRKNKKNKPEIIKDEAEIKEPSTIKKTVKKSKSSKKNQNKKRTK